MKEAKRIKKELNKILKSVFEKQKYYENTFFPKQRLKKKEGRFELLGLSLLDVNGFNADILWFDIAPKLRKENFISIDKLLIQDVNSIKEKLIKVGYNRGEKYTLKFAYNLRKLAEDVKIKYEEDISNLFKRYKKHNSETAKNIIKEISNFQGIGQKVATMFLKFMISTYGIWKWKGEEKDLYIAIPNDFQVRKVFIRLLGKEELPQNILREYDEFSKIIEISFMAIDDIFWNIGRIFCRKKYPSCHYCILEPVCKFATYRRLNETDKIAKINSLLQ